MCIALPVESSVAAQSLGSVQLHPQFVHNAHLRVHAHEASDFGMLGRFCMLAGFSEAHIDESGIKLMLKTVKMLRLCDYSREDILCMLGHAVVYSRRTLAVCGPQMSGREAGHTAVLLIYLAHSYTQDETCPIRVWHQHLFRGYCSVNELDGVVLKMMSFQRYVLRVEADELLELHLQLADAKEYQIPELVGVPRATCAGVMGCEARCAPVRRSQRSSRVQGWLRA
jgi:hypothetical protein